MTTTDTTSNGSGNSDLAPTTPRVSGRQRIAALIAQLRDGGHVATAAAMAQTLKAYRHQPLFAAALDAAGTASDLRDLDARRDQLLNAVILENAKLQGALRTVATDGHLTAAGQAAKTTEIRDGARAVFERANSDFADKLVRASEQMLSAAKSTLVTKLAEGAATLTAAQLQERATLVVTALAGVADLDVLGSSLAYALPSPWADRVLEAYAPVICADPTAGAAVIAALEGQLKVLALTRAEDALAGDATIRGAVARVVLLEEKVTALQAALTLLRRDDGNTYAAQLLAQSSQEKAGSAA